MIPEYRPGEHVVWLVLDHKLREIRIIELGNKDVFKTEIQRVVYCIYKTIRGKRREKC